MAIQQIQPARTLIRWISGGISDTTSQVSFLEDPHTSYVDEVKLIASRFCDYLRHIPQAEQIIVAERGSVIFVYTVVDDATREMEAEVYSQELRLARAYPSVSFDFNLIKRRGRPLNSIFTVSGKEIIQTC